jgi:hypothetical protein
MCHHASNITGRMTVMPGPVDAQQLKYTPLIYAIQQSNKHDSSLDSCQHHQKLWPTVFVPVIRITYVYIRRGAV